MLCTKFYLYFGELLDFTSMIIILESSLKNTILIETRKDIPIVPISEIFLFVMTPKVIFLRHVALS